MVCTGDLRTWLPDNYNCSQTPSIKNLFTTGTSATISYLSSFGHHFDIGSNADSQSFAAMMSLLRSMQLRELVQMHHGSTYEYAFFLFENVRAALAVFDPALPAGAWLAHVVPYRFLNEDPGILFMPRQRLQRVLRPLIVGVRNCTQVAHIIANAIPTLRLLIAPADGASTQPITWRSETSPAMLSVEQVARFGGSCTGTAIVFGAALRAVGVPARLAGCSQSVPGDDHHWVEFLDPGSVGPFGDFWHTKEGTSAGNEGGPWDHPSGPMANCVHLMVPGSKLNAIYATSAASTAAWLPLLWASDSVSVMWAFVGGIDRSSEYAAAWSGPTFAAAYEDHVHCDNFNNKSAVRRI